MTGETTNRAKAYQTKRNWLRLYNLLLTLAILELVILFRWTDMFYSWAAVISSRPYVMLSIYFLFFSIYLLILSLPLDFYSGFMLEHEYQLSNQNFRGWLAEFIKQIVLSFAMMLALVILLYALIWNFEHWWWLWAWIAYAAFSLILGKLFPVLIIPLFYQYSPIHDEELKQRIENLARRFGMEVKNISSLNLSKTTKKANAAFTGFGKTKRVILADTLLKSFSHDEIETVLAHELGHFKHRDIWKQFFLGVVISFIGFWICFVTIDTISRFFGYAGAGDIRAFPLVCSIFFLFGLVTGPLANGFSRHVEFRADRFALEANKNKNAFISAMQKLSLMNLADPEPHPVIEFLFYDHPPIGKRIRVAERWEPQ